MKQKTHEKKGFSLIEIVLAIVLISISLGFFIYFQRNSTIKADINGQATEIVSYLRIARSDASSGKNDRYHGVHLEPSAYVIFKGEEYDAGEPTNQLIELPDTMIIENINLNGDGDDIIFVSPLGETDTYGSFDLSSTKMEKTITIEISKLGIINY